MKLKYMFLFLLVIMQYTSAKEYSLLKRDVDAGPSANGKIHISVIWNSDTKQLHASADFPAFSYRGGGQVFSLEVMAENCPNILFGSPFPTEVKQCLTASTIMVDIGKRINLYGLDLNGGELISNLTQTKHYSQTITVPGGLKQLHLCFQTAPLDYVTNSVGACQSGEIPPDEPVQEETNCTFNIPANSINYGTLNQNDLNGSSKEVDFTVSCSADSNLSLSFNNGNVNVGNTEIDIDLGGGLAAHLETQENLHAGANTPVWSKIHSTLVTTSQTVSVGKHSNSAILKAEWP